MSPLAEGRELKWQDTIGGSIGRPSPLAEGRELKYFTTSYYRRVLLSPLAEGRELKFYGMTATDPGKDVAPRGGA